MTVSTTTVSVSYAGDGSTTAFPITFQFGTSADLSVVLVNDATGTETAKSLTTHYTVSQSAGGTGTLTMLTAPASGYTLRIDRVTALTQPDSLRNRGSYYPETIEGMFDRLARQIQDNGGRALKVHPSDAASVDLRLPRLTAGSAILVNEDGDGFTFGVAGEDAVTDSAANAQAASDSADAAAAATVFASVSTNDPALSFADGVVRAGSSTNGGTIAFMFDDGYRSNYLYALPIFKRYGFAATLAQEIDRIGEDYGGNPDYPVLTAEDLRELIAAGWEVCNHPALTLTDTEAQMVTAAQTENQLLRDLLSGAKVKNYTTGVVTSATPTHPEFANYPIKTAVYRGGLRNDTSDKAYRFLFDKVRSINGTVAMSGDHLFAFGPWSERTTQISAWPVDVSSNPVEKTLAFIDSVAQTNSTAILYGHDTPATTGGATPYIVASDLERILQRCHDRGVAVVPLGRLHKGNAIADSTFEDSSGSLLATSGDTVAFSEVDTLNGATRCVELTATGFRANFNTGYITERFVCEPFCRYRIRVRYKIDTDLTLSGGIANRNHGLNIQFQTFQGNTAGYVAGDHALSTAVLNDASDRLPYLATVGYDEMVFEAFSGYGQIATVGVVMYNCTGTAKVGQIIVEKLDSILDRPLSGTANFNTTIGSSTIYLPSPNTTNERQWDWELSVFASPVEPSVTYTYAFADSASIGAPVEGNTCYVIGVGLNAFAGQTGKLATYTAGAWAFSSIAAGTFFKVSNAEGIANRRFRHRGVKTGGGPIYEEFFADVAPDSYPIKRLSPGQYKVFNTSGLRTDAFTWVARPRAA